MSVGGPPSLLLRGAEVAIPWGSEELARERRKTLECLQEELGSPDDLSSFIGQIYASRRGVNIDTLFLKSRNFGNERTCSKIHGTLWVLVLIHFQSGRCISLRNVKSIAYSDIQIWKERSSQSFDHYGVCPLPPYHQLPAPNLSESPL